VGGKIAAAKYHQPFDAIFAGRWPGEAEAVAVGQSSDKKIWLARKDSNLRSPDPESVDLFSRFLARREHETHRFLAIFLPSLVTRRKRGQVATSWSPDSLKMRGEPLSRAARNFGRHR
jgi:hypothetical protein